MFEWRDLGAKDLLPAEMRRAIDERIPAVAANLLRRTKLTPQSVEATVE